MIEIVGLRASAAAGAARIESITVANEPITDTRRRPAWPRGEARARRCAWRRWLVAAALAGIAALCQAPAYAQTDVPSDWPLKPSGLGVGDEFRLLNMTKNPQEANSTNIADYDSYVQGRISAIGHADIKAFSGHFNVLGSTATVNARSHTGTTGSGGVPIYWLNGAKVADDYADFYDGSWSNANAARLEDGTLISQNRRDQPICTGTNNDGTTTSMPLGNDPCTATTIGSSSTLSGTTHSSTSEGLPRYLALSGVFRVDEDAVAPTIPAVESVAITSYAGSDREYAKDDVIEVTVTFSEAVAVTGTPKIKVKAHADRGAKNADYAEAGNTASELVFKYTVRAADYNYDGINVPKNGLGLSGGTIKNQAGDTNADLAHARTAPNSLHRVHIKPTVSSVTVASTPSYATSYATGDTIQIDLTFNRKVSVFTAAGTPTLGVIIGSTRREAAYTTTVGDTVVRFGYVVQDADLDLDGIKLMNNAITWNGGFIIRQEHGDIADKDPLQVAGNGGTATGTNAQSGHKVHAEVAPGVDISPTSLTVAEGGSDTYEVNLTTLPTGTVTVTPSVADNSDVTVDPTSLTFTIVNWEDVQAVTVSAAQDADADADTATIEHAVSGADYGSVLADAVAVTVTEDDMVSTRVTLTVSATAVAENAVATQVTVTGELDGVARSTATVVTVSVGASADTATEGTDYTDVSDLTMTIPAHQTSATASFTFTPTNDDIDETDEALTVDGTVQGLTVTPATLTITDDDTRGVGVSRTTLPVAEGGSDTYTVKLTSEPTGPVTVTPSVADNSDVTVRPSSLTFTYLDWSTAQTVTVEAAHDVDADADTATIEHAVSGADYGSVDTAGGDVIVTVTEDETASTEVALTVSTPTLAEDAGATQVTVTAELNEAPRASATVVTVSVGATGEPATEGTDYIAVNDFSLTIPADQTSATADFTFTPVDDGIVEVDETLSVDGTAQGLTVTPATMTITDNDTLGLVLNVSSLSVPEGRRSPYTLVLGSQPTATVTVDISGAAGTVLTLNKTSLTFTSLNWNEAQTVQVSAAQDNTDSLDDEVTLTHTASGGDYASLSVDLVVTVPDNDAASIYGVTVISSPLHTSNAYGRGETIRIQAAFNVAVAVDTSGGTPAIQVNFGHSGNVGVRKEFEYVRGSGSSRLEFEYEVQQGDIDGDGLDLVDNGLALNGATIKDTLSGRDAVLLYTGGEQGSHLVVGSRFPLLSNSPRSPCPASP